MNSYIPNRGDIVWLDFTPQIGHEQHGKRPAVVGCPSGADEEMGKDTLVVLEV